MDDRVRGDQVLPPLNETATCPKCGGDDIAMHYRKGDGPVSDYKYPEPLQLHWHEQEHILRVCQRCRYDWPEAVLVHGQKMFEVRTGEGILVGHIDETGAFVGNMTYTNDTPDG